MERQTIDRFLSTLRDGKYHPIGEIIGRTEMKEQRIRLIIAFLQKFHFIESNEAGEIKLSTTTKKFLDKLDETDHPQSFYEEITA
jgi:hypothetical protein